MLLLTKQSFFKLGLISTQLLKLISKVHFRNQVNCKVSLHNEVLSSYDIQVYFSLIMPISRWYGFMDFVSFMRWEICIFLCWKNWQNEF